MQAGLTADTFSKLLLRLDADREQAAEEYEDLRRKLLRFFEWRSAPFPEEHADEVLNRLAKKIAAGIEVKNVSSYCYEIARLVLLEVLKGNEGKQASLEAIEVAVAPESNDETSRKEIRLACLDDCLRALPQGGRELIVEYYQDVQGDQISRRRALAARLGLNREALANRAQRLRDKLERCVTRCTAKKGAI